MSCPTLRIERLQSDLSQLPHVFDKVIFISANAVEALFAQADKSFINKHVGTTKAYAIGNATAKKAKQFGVDVELFSTAKFDSETFLAAPVMQNVSEENILIIKGKNGRTLLNDTLISRGANVVGLDLYEREKERFCEENWEKLCNANNPVLLITSIESWNSLLNGLRGLLTNDIDLAQEGFRAVVPQKIKTVVMSERIAQQMRTDGWLNTVEVVKTQSNQGIIDAISLLSD